jgi:succinate dehydrogenase / fumarate reductase cytochrome b subunit
VLNLSCFRKHIMSKSAILSSSIAKKYWMAVTGLFLCLFLVGHLLGNLQLIIKSGEEGRRAFNEYAYFMTHNIFVKVLSYATYISILFHAVDGLMLAIQNRKARPIPYSYNNPSANSSSAARQMAILGTAILVFIVIHMANFWWKMKYSSDPMPVHTYIVKSTDQMGMTKFDTLYYTHTPSLQPIPVNPMIVVKNGTELYLKEVNLKIGDTYKDLHKIVMAFFGKSVDGAKTNQNALLAVILYVLSMAVLSFHLMHGFASAFQSLGINHRRYTPIIKVMGKVFAIVVPAAFALIPIMIFLTK